jgi:hypothetical protein
LNSIIHSQIDSAEPGPLGQEKGHTVSATSHTLPATDNLAASPVGSVKPASDSGMTHEVDPDFLEHLRREAMDQPELPWEP